MEWFDEPRQPESRDSTRSVRALLRSANGAAPGIAALRAQLLETCEVSVIDTSGRALDDAAVVRGAIDERVADLLPPEQALLEQAIV